jgi:tyrosine-protein kinase Etk/Wzc
MEETDKIPHKLPIQEIDYFKIAKILLSRWYWVAGSLTVCMIIANVYLWYTPKTYSTSGTMKFEEKKSELPDLSGLTNVAANQANASRVQSETIVLQSTPLLLNAIRHLDYRISFYIVGRVVNRTNEIYPRKPLDIQLVKFDSLNFFRELVTFKPIDKFTFSISYNTAGKDVQNSYRYGVPFTIGPTSFSIKYSGDLPKTVAYLFKLNAAEDLVGRVRGGLHTSETAKNSNIISLQEVDSNPQFAADVLNAIMKEYLNYDRNQRTLSASQMILFIDKQLDFLSGEVKGSENSIAQYQKNKKLLDVNSASETAISKAKEIEGERSLLKIQLLAIDQLKEEIIR